MNCWKRIGFDKTIVAIGGDSTNVNTGWKSGARAHLETLLRGKLVWLVWVCMCLQVHQYTYWAFPCHRSKKKDQRQKVDFFYEM